VTDVSADMLLAEMKKGRGDADYASIAQRYFPSGKPFVRHAAPKATAPPKTEPPKVEPVSVATEAAPVSAPTSATEESPGKSPNEKQEKSEEKEPLPGENLSGGIRGWLSRLGSSFRRQS
jgi:hypothetical protein